MSGLAPYPVVFCRRVRNTLSCQVLSIFPVVECRFKSVETPRNPLQSKEVSTQTCEVRTSTKALSIEGKNALKSQHIMKRNGRMCVVDRGAAPQMMGSNSFLRKTGRPSEHISGSE